MSNDPTQLNPARPHSRWTSFWLALSAVLFVVLWRLCVVASQRHLLAVATEIGSLALPKEELAAQELVPSGDGHALVYFMETETGLGTYFCDATGGHRKLLFEQRERYYAGDLSIVAWSPDDRFFACAYKFDVAPQPPSRKLVIYDGNSGEPVVKIEALWDSKFIWLSAHAFAYSRFNGAWLKYEENADGKWGQTQIIKKFADGDLKNLTATSGQSVAWQQGGAILTYDFATGDREKIWESTTNSLENFTYSAKTGDFLLTCRDRYGRVFITFRPQTFGDQENSILGMTRDALPTSHADLSEAQGTYIFDIKTGTASAPIQVVWNGMVEYYRLAGDHLYFTGNQADSPPGIWEYNVKSKVFNCLDSSLKGRLKYTQLVVPTTGVCTSETGEQVNYHVWTPPHLTPGKKYPLIIGQTHYMWFNCQQVAANGGFFFAAGDRISWWNGLNNWSTDVMALYEQFAKNSNIDTNQVYVFATSAESWPLAQLVAAKPDLWRGVILFEAGAQPDLSQTHFPRMYLEAGADDGGTVKQLTKYQETAARTGVPATLILQDGVQHITRSIATERERTRQLAQFLLEN